MSIKPKSIFVFVILALSILSGHHNFQQVSASSLSLEQSNPPTSAELRLALDLGHGTDLNFTRMTKAADFLNSSFSPLGVRKITSSISSPILEEIQVLMLLGGEEEFTDEEVEAVYEFLDLGNSLLVASSARNEDSQNTILNNFLNAFGLQFNGSLVGRQIPGQNQIDPRLVVQDFITPVTPAVENISQIVFVNGTFIAVNQTINQANNEGISLQIKDRYSLMLRNSSEPEGFNNTLAAAIELENGARIVALGSIEFFYDPYFDPWEANSTTLVSYLDNTKFTKNVLNWLGGATGNLRIVSDEVSDNLKDLQIGSLVSGNVTVLDQNNRSLQDLSVSLVVERTGTILAKSLLLFQGNDTYTGRISTSGIGHGWINLAFHANRIGYKSISKDSGRIFLLPAENLPRAPDLSMIALLSTATVIFLSTALIFWRVNRQESEE